MIDLFVTVGVVVRMDDGRGTAMKENDNDRWSFDDVVL
jgi:hypothetical protein